MYPGPSPGRRSLPRASSDTLMLSSDTRSSPVGGDSGCSHLAGRETETMGLHNVTKATVTKGVSGFYPGLWRPPAQPLEGPTHSISQTPNQWLQKYRWLPEVAQPGSCGVPPSSAVAPLVSTPPLHWGPLEDRDDFLPAPSSQHLVRDLARSSAPASGN